MLIAKKIYFTINEKTLELKGPYTRSEVIEAISVSHTDFRKRFNKTYKAFRPTFIHTPIHGFYIIRDIELDVYENAANFIKVSKKSLEDFKKAKELNNNDSYNRKLKGNRKILKSDTIGKIPEFKVKTLNIYTGEVTHYQDVRELAETENYLLADILACIGSKASPIFQGKLILLKYTKSKEKPFRTINDFKNEIYFPNRPVILETNMKTKQQKVYASSNDLCKHIPFDPGEVMFGLRYENGFSFNEYFYKLINN